MHFFQILNKLGVCPSLPQTRSNWSKQQQQQTLSLFSTKWLFSWFHLNLGTAVFFASLQLGGKFEIREQKWSSFFKDQNRLLLVFNALKRQEGAKTKKPYFIWRFKRGTFNDKWQEFGIFTAELNLCRKRQLKLDYYQSKHHEEEKRSAISNFCGDARSASPLKCNNGFSRKDPGSKK